MSSRRRDIRNPPTVRFRFQLTRGRAAALLVTTVVYLLAVAFLAFGGDIRALVDLDPAVTKAGATVGATYTASVTAEGHPTQISITATSPYAEFRTLAICDDSTVCAGAVTFDDCGNWLISGVIEYAHEDPAYPGHNYQIAESIPVSVIGCDIFADGFETGDTSNWSKTTDPLTRGPAEGAAESEPE